MNSGDAETLHIVRFQPHQIEQVCTIENTSFPDPFSERFLIELSRLYPDTFLVAERRGQVLGYTVAGAHHDRAHIFSLAVIEEWRRRHVGLKLMRVLTENLRSKAVREIVLEVAEANVAARTLYERLGFKRAYIIRGYYKNGEDAVVYNLRL
jgi:ribosomal-protein-alanine N-acetyltransferase